MASILECIQSLVYRYGGEVRRFARLDEPSHISIDGDTMESRLTIAATTTKIVYDNTSDVFANLKFFSVRSDYDVVVECLYDVANAYGTTLQTFYVEGSGEAGVFGPALIIANAQAYAGYTAQFAAGTLCYPEKLTVRNVSSTAAQVEILMGE